MHVTASLDAPCPVPDLRRWVDDLERYPEWLGIVPRAERIPGDEAAWAVELRATLGPLARSKRLRMVRTVDELHHLRFERAELDDKEHSDWVLDVHLQALDSGTRLTMTLHYGGAFGGSILERLLGDEIEASKPRLLALATGDEA
jgi:hypothetical protein